MSEYRTEHDSMGAVEVPTAAYYGAQTQRERVVTLLSVYMPPVLTLDTSQGLPR